MADSKFWCSACSVTLNSKDQYIQHTSGRKHLNKLQPNNGQSAKPASGPLARNSSAGVAIDGGEGSEDPFRKVQFITEDGMSSLPDIDLPPPPPPPPRGAQKRKAEDLDGCDLCDVKFNSESQKDIHVGGKKHQKKMKLMMDDSSDPLGLSTESGLGACELCHVEYSSVLIRDQHLDGAKHRRKVQLQESVHQETDMCKLCNVTYSSEASKLLHVQGRKHQRKVQENNTPETAPVKNATSFRCLFCNISVNSLDQLEIHRQGTKHKATLQKMKDIQQGKVVDDLSVYVKGDNRSVVMETSVNKIQNHCDHTRTVLPP